MSIGLIVTRGFSNGALVGTIKDLVTMGYDISEGIWTDIPIAATTWTDEAQESTSWVDNTPDNTTWTDI